MGFSVFTAYSGPRPQKFKLPIRYGLISHPSLSHTPSYRSPLSLSPHSMPSHFRSPSIPQVCGVYAVAILLASQISISAQHAPYFPFPILLLRSFGLGSQSITLASPETNLTSWGHCASQYPVPYLAPALLVPRPLPPSAGISEKYIAPFIPHCSSETSTSKENSRFLR